MKKILILGVGAPQYDAIKELKEMGYEVHSIAQKKDGPGADISDKFENINFMDTEKTIDYIKKNDIDVLYSVGSDLAMPQSAMISEKLGKQKFVTEEVAKICNNKNLMRETLGKDFKGSIEFQIVESLDEKVELKLPFIVKPSDSQGQRGISIIDTTDKYKEAFEYAKQFTRNNKVILERYVKGPEISVNFYLVDSQIKYIESSDRIVWEEKFGLIHKHLVPAEVLNEESNKKLEVILQEACKKIGIYNGPVYAQVIIEDNEPYIIEITPRLDGCHMWNVLEKYTNVNLLKLTFEHLLYGKITELDKFKISNKEYVLEFICQEPNTPASYLEFQEKLNNFPSFCYYKQGENIRPVNNVYEKIGYFIYEK